MKFTGRLSDVLMLLWALLSGHFEPLLLSLGLVSVILTVMMSLWISIVDAESHPAGLLRQLVT